MKKLYYRLLLTMIVLASVMPFIMKGQDGRPLMTLANLKMPDLKVPGKETMSTIVDGASDNNPLAKKDAEVTVYRWQDDQGIWHYSDAVNPQGESEALAVKLNNNVSESRSVNNDMAAAPAQVDVDKLLQPGAIPLLNAGETLQQARNVEKLMQQRYQNQERLLSR